MPYTWYDGASEGSFRFRINDGSVNGQESPEPAYTETKASILRRYFNTKARFDYIKPQIEEVSHIIQINVISFLEKAKYNIKIATG